ncbi:2-phospho-L-lactate guanylyltransferase [Pseudokineococcus lusitanus]|uniref:Phosphoenolpyruvate guanylyltransferase n=1 Tax=Pseudokineococcus lusitanus TaxID=763993 RepID=A0A3N1HMN1_9ACTN|nr:2-phospho-L-lactate guanylyltransferase [Pseudokineococcus lusitanus]ROP43787.1 2-phospho-L-lactate guanylyltransferase [Pseudokineococcus lusitanus]
MPPHRTPGRPGDDAPRRWHVVLPVKGGADAKSRLGGEPVARRALALAMAVDCLEAVTRTPGVAGTLVVTDDDAAARAARDLGARVVRPGPVPPGRRALDAAVADGLCAAAALAADGEDATTGVAVLLADLPALRPEDLAVALRAAADALDDGAAAVLVPDAAGTGTCLQAARRAADVPVAYGTGSAARHERAGARRLALDVPRLRRDVDVADDLRAARVLGVGRRTAAALDGAAHDVGLRGRAS